MQPFGLLNFLKEALQPVEGETPPSTTANIEVAEGNQEANTPTSPSSLDNSTGNAAYQAFLDRHEQTARKLRKK